MKLLTLCLIIAGCGDNFLPDEIQISVPITSCADGTLGEIRGDALLLGEGGGGLGVPASTTPPYRLSAVEFTVTSSHQIYVYFAYRDLTGAGHSAGSVVHVPASPRPRHVLMDLSTDAPEDRLRDLDQVMIVPLAVSSAKIEDVGIVTSR